MQDVVDFIKHFKGSEEVFLHGCCYWFAWILKERFDDCGYLVDIYHDPIEGHFVARFIRHDDYFEPITPDEDIRFFDVRGDVTDLYNEEQLENMWVMSRAEERRYGRLICDCKYFLEPDNYPAWLKNELNKVL